LNADINRSQGSTETQRGISDLPGRGGALAYTATVSGLISWCASDLFGGFIGYFYSEAAALAAADAVHAQMSSTFQGKYRSQDVLQVFFVFTHNNGRVTAESRYFTADPSNGIVTSDLYRSKGELIAAIGHPRPSTPTRR
jgi:hypothetical protein